MKNVNTAETFIIIGTIVLNRDIVIHDEECVIITVLASSICGIF